MTKKGEKGYLTFMPEKEMASLPASLALGRDRGRQGLRAVSRETRDGEGLHLAMTMEGNI